MNIQETNPSLKAFLFFILVLICGLFSMILALYFEKLFPGMRQDQNLPVNSYPSESLKAGFLTDFSAISNISSITTEKGSLSGSLTPPSAATIILLPLNKGEKSVYQIGTSGHFTIQNINQGDYEIVVDPATSSGLPEKRIDLISIRSGLNSIGIFELD